MTSIEPYNTVPQCRIVILLSCRRIFVLILIVIWSLITLSNSMPIATTAASALFNQFDGSSTSIEFTGSPKIVDIALPLSLSRTEDLITWATYAIRLMASRINVTLSQMINDSQPTLHGNVYNAEIVPRIGTVLQKAMTEMLNTHATSATTETTVKATTIKKTEHPKNAETNNVFQTFQQPLTVRTESSLNPRAFNIYTKDIYARNPYNNNPYAGILVKAPNEFNPFTKYSSNIVINNPYEQSGSGVFEEQAIYPGVGYLPLANVNDDLHNRQKIENNFTSYDHETPSTKIAVMTTEASFQVENLNGPIEPKNKNNLKARMPTTTLRPLITVPFEAVITITKENSLPPQQQQQQLPASVISSSSHSLQSTSPEQSLPDSYSTINNQDTDSYYTTTMRDPPDQFPPFFEHGMFKRNQKTRIQVTFENDELEGPKNDQKKKNIKTQKSKKRPSTSLEKVIQKIIFPAKKTKNNTLDDNIPPIIRIVSERNKKFKSALNKQFQNRLKNNETFENQEVDDYVDEKQYNAEKEKQKEVEKENEESVEEEEEEEEEVGSLTAIFDLLPLVAPILEDVSNPNSTTDLGELIQAVIPLVQDILEGDEDNPGLNIGGTIGPILANLSEGKEGQGSDVAAILGPILTLIAPLIGPVIGPIIGPLLRLSSNPPDKGFSLGAFISSVAAPLSQPTEPGGMSPFSSLVTQVVAGLSKEISTGKTGSDFGAFIGSVLMGVIAGTSAGLSGGSSADKNPSPLAYAPQQGYGPVSSSTNYGNTAVPANSVNPIQLIGTSLKDILNAGVSVVSSLITAVTGLLGTSSQDQSPPSYGLPLYYTRPRRSIYFSTHVTRKK